MLKEIVAGARTYGKPVMFVHGDTSPYCWERGFGGADNLWRLNSAGDFVLIDAVKVTVEPESKEPFQAVGVQSGLTPGAC